MDKDENSKNYLRHLMHYAVTHTKLLSERPVTSFFRNKDDDYWRDVDNNGKVMMPIRKDFNGDSKSPINGMLKGVFLDITLRGGCLTSSSPFGPTRTVFPIEGLYDETTDLFFTDFYCKGKKRNGTKNHYITLVLTKTGSAADHFCKKKLLQLNPETNRFFRRQGTSVPNFTSIANPPMHVEVFYTESVDLRRLEERFGTSRVYRCKTGTFGKGSSTPGGIQKDTRCAVCNPRSTYRSHEPLDIEIVQDDVKVESISGFNIPKFGKSDDNDTMKSTESNMTSGVNLTQHDIAVTSEDVIIEELRDTKTLSIINSNENKDLTSEDTDGQRINVIERRITRSMAKEMLKEVEEKKRSFRMQTRSMKRKQPMIMPLSGNELQGTEKRRKRTFLKLLT